MKESLLKLAELLAENEEFAKKFSLLKSVDEQYDFAQKSVSGYTKEEFVNFLNELEKAYKLKQELSPEDIEKVSGGANAKTKAAAMAMLALSAVGSAAPMLTSASAYGSGVNAELGRVTAGYDDDDDDDDVAANAGVENVENAAVAPMGVENEQIEADYYESLTDQDVGNNDVAVEFDPEIVPPGFAEDVDFPLDRQLGKSWVDGDYLHEEGEEGWALVGDILYYFWRNGSTDYTVSEIIPLFYNNESRKACDSKEKPIKVIKIPDYVNGHPVTGMLRHVLERITELFPDLECVILPRTLERVDSEESLHPKYSRPLKIFVKRGTNYRYLSNKDRYKPSLQPGLHVMQPQNRGISKDVLAIPPSEPGCTIM